MRKKGEKLDVIELKDENQKAERKINMIDINRHIPPQNVQININLGLNQIMN